MLSLKAKSIGSYARSLLDNVRQPVRVEHVFTSTLYLRFSQDEMVVVSAHPWRAPFIINVTMRHLFREGFSSYVRPMSSARFHEGLLVIGEELAIDISPADTYEGLSHRFIGVSTQKDDIQRRIHALIHLSGFTASALRSPASRTVCGKICEAIVRGRLIAQRTVSEIIGLGEGFTPSGDDFYVGLASALSFVCTRLHVRMACELVRKLTLELKDALGMTTWASRVYLRYALSGMLDELVEGTMIALYTGKSVDELLDSALRLASRGHDSGIFLLMGLTVGLAELHALKSSWKEKLCDYIV